MGATEDEALAKRDEYKRGLTVKKSSYTLGSYAEYWLPIHKASVKASTYNTYASLLTNVIKPIASVKLNRLTSDDISETLAAMNGKSSTYIHNAKVILTEILDSAVDAGYLMKNPIRAQSVKPPKGTKGTHRAITPHERSVILNTPHRMRLAALIMLYCGLRRGEVIGLQAQDIQGDTLHVRRSVYYISNAPIISTPKTRNSIRAVPVPDFILPLIPKMNRDCYILSGKPEPLTERTFTHNWTKYCDAINCKIRCHDLRHTYCTWLRDCGVDIHQAILWMGHADEKMIIRIYDHPGIEREIEARNLIKSALSMRIGMQESDQSL